MILSLASAASAHDFWITFDEESSTLQVEGGHYFARNEGAPQARTIRRWALQNSAGDWEEWPEKEGPAWSVPLFPPGLYRSLLILQAPRAPRPMYYAQSLFRVGTASIPWPEPMAAGLEIGVKADGNDVLLSLLQDGRAQQAVLTVQVPGASSRRLPTAPDTLARLLLEADKRYLVTATTGGQTVSLSFFTPDK